MKQCCAETFKRFMWPKDQPLEMAGFTYDELIDLRAYMEKNCVENLLVFLKATF